MIRFDRDKARVLRGIIRTLAAAADVGMRRPGEDPVLGADSRCDLCGGRPRVGRLLVSALGIGHVVHEDGTADFRGWVAEDPLDAMYWVCLPCHRLLRRDPDDLLRRLLAVYGTGQAN